MRPERVTGFIEAASQSASWFSPKRPTTYETTKLADLQGRLRISQEYWGWIWGQQANQLLVPSQESHHLHKQADLQGF